MLEEVGLEVKVERGRRKQQVTERLCQVYIHICEDGLVRMAILEVSVRVGMRVTYPGGGHPPPGRPPPPHRQQAPPTLVMVVEKQDHLKMEGRSSLTSATSVPGEASRSPEMLNSQTPWRSDAQEPPLHPARRPGRGALYGGVGVVAGEGGVGHGRDSRRL